MDYPTDVTAVGMFSPAHHSVISSNFDVVDYFAKQLDYCVDPKCEACVSNNRLKVHNERVHCTLCPGTVFKPNNKKKVLSHIEKTHTAPSIVHGEYRFMTCSISLED